MPYATPELTREYQRQYRELNREKLRKYAADNYQKNKSTLSAKAKTYRAEHPDLDRKYYVAGRIRSPWRFLIQAAQKRARDKNILFDLTHEWAEHRWTGKCELTNLPFNLEFSNRSGPKHMSPSIDRKIPSLGYTQANCRIILHCVNSFKNSGTDAEMFLVAKALLKYSLE